MPLPPSLVRDICAALMRLDASDTIGMPTSHALRPEALARKRLRALSSAWRSIYDAEALRHGILIKGGTQFDPLSAETINALPQRTRARLIVPLSYFNQDVTRGDVHKPVEVARTHVAGFVVSLRPDQQGLGLATIGPLIAGSPLLRYLFFSGDAGAALRVLASFQKTITERGDVSPLRALGGHFNIGNADFARLAFIIASRSPRLASLELRRSPITTQTAQELALAFPPRLRRLDLAMCSIVPADLTRVLGAVARSTTMRALDISYLLKRSDVDGGLDPAAANAFANAVDALRGSSLEQLDLAGNELGEISDRIASTLVEMPRLAALSLSGTDFSSPLTLAKAPALHTLTLKSAELGDRWAEIGPLLARLHALDISSDAATMQQGAVLTTDDIELLADGALQQARSLRVLDVSGSRVGFGGMRALSALLDDGDMPALQKIYFVENESETARGVEMLRAAAARRGVELDID